MRFNQSFSVTWTIAIVRVLNYLFPTPNCMGWTPPFCGSQSTTSTFPKLTIVVCEAPHVLFPRWALSTNPGIIPSPIESVRVELKPSPLGSFRFGGRRCNVHTSISLIVELLVQPNLKGDTAWLQTRTFIWRHLKQSFQDPTYVVLEYYDVMGKQPSVQLINIKRIETWNKNFCPIGPTGLYADGCEAKIAVSNAP